MLRPDFTVPIVQRHMADAREPARYTYAGPVWRRQPYGSHETREFWQVGYEIFDRETPEAADAEVFALFATALQGSGAAPVIGDLALLFAAIDALDTHEARKIALRRHVWRPRRFARLLDRFAGNTRFACDDRDWPTDVASAVRNRAQLVGQRGVDEIAARIEMLREEAAAPRLSVEEVGMITTLLSIRGTAAACVNGLSALARSFPALKGPVNRLEARLDALHSHGIDGAELQFDAAFGRQSMEYYDGFTFAFRGPDANATPVAIGGRYDALTRALGGDVVPAVGGVIRPGILATMKDGH